ncbi:MAG TPA: hypothetical protein VJ831_06670 [Jatrophihabitantaceae bacterium]|nr:hypothetical protein [Jatrophihabitantaceae bacterium]
MSSAKPQQFVNAALVGAVVIVLGFASGIGVESSTSAQQPTPTTPSQSATPAAPVPPQQSTARPPINYTGIALPNPPTRSALPTTSPTNTPTRPSPSPSTTTRTVTQPKPPVTTTCTPNLLGGLLEGLLPLVDGLLGLPDLTAAGGSPDDACGTSLLGNLPLLGGTQ